MAWCAKYKANNAFCQHKSVFSIGLEPGLGLLNFCPLKIPFFLFSSSVWKYWAMGRQNSRGKYNKNRKIKPFVFFSQISVTTLYRYRISKVKSKLPVSRKETVKLQTEKDLIAFLSMYEQYLWLFVAHYSIDNLRTVCRLCISCIYACGLYSLIGCQQRLGLIVQTLTPPVYISLAALPVSVSM